MFAYFYNFFLRVHKAILVTLILVLFCFIGSAQDPVDGNPVELPPSATQLPPAQLYQALKDKNLNPGDNRLGTDKSSIDKVDKDSLKRESTPQSAITGEDTYGMHLFTGGNSCGNQPAIHTSFGLSDWGK
ncbi:MAG: hypothetical protein IPJ81_00220 [Chitinophagaceae bacterium]|nr:hypothetical protein [Chitinophagaceae bacterium]